MSSAKDKPGPADKPGVFRPRMIVCDLDGTILGRDGILSRRTLHAIRACHDQGILFAVATARSRHSVDKILPDELPVDGYITSGGALAYVGTEQVFSSLLPPERTDALTAALFAMHGQGYVSQITLHSPAGDFSNMSRVSPKRLLHNHCYADFSQPLNQSAMSLTVAIKNPEALESLLQSFPDLHHVGYRGERLHRFSQADGDKGTALTALCAHLGIPLSQVLAFGDDSNDIELLVAAGRSVAVAGAAPPLLAVAEEVCPPLSKDGVGRYLEKRVLGQSWRQRRWQRLRGFVSPSESKTQWKLGSTTPQEATEEKRAAQSGNAQDIAEDEKTSRKKENENE